MAADIDGRRSMLLSLFLLLLLLLLLVVVVNACTAVPPSIILVVVNITMRHMAVVVTKRKPTILKVALSFLPIVISQKKWETTQVGLWSGSPERDDGGMFARRGVKQ